MGIIGLGAVTKAQKKYADKAAKRSYKPKKTQFRKDIDAAKKAIDAGIATDSAIIKKYGIEAFNAVNAENIGIVGLGGVDTLPKANFGNVTYKVIKDGKKFNVMVSSVGGSSWKFSKPTSKKEAIKLLNMIAKDKAKRTGQI